MDEMETELEQLKDEIFRMIGKNIVLFQQLEQILKFLTANAEVSAYASEFNATVEQQTMSIRDKTMGVVVNRFLNSPIWEPEQIPNPPDELKEARISFGFTISCDEASYEERKKTFALLVAERNKLVHHLLDTWDYNSIESSEIVIKNLELQHEKIRHEIKYLQRIPNLILGLMKIWPDELKRYFKLSKLRQSRLVILLAKISIEIARSDGWTLLASAGKIIRQHMPEEVADLKQRYGYSTLKKLMLATEIFDVYEEPTNKGGVRVLYRIKPEWRLENNTFELVN